MPGSRKARVVAGDGIRLLGVENRGSRNLILEEGIFFRRDIPHAEAQSSGVGIMLELLTSEIRFCELSYKCGGADFAWNTTGQENEHVGK
jgi:hypothetical protein